MTDYAPVFPHGNVEEIADDVFMLRGSIKMNPLVRITRNMAIIRNGNELSLINPVRVSLEVEAQLKALGEVTNIIRLGAFHGIDDLYYVDKFGTRLWSQPGGTTYPKPEIDEELNASTQLPFSNAQIFEFEGTPEPECVLLLNTGKGLLLTCDAIQNYGDYSYNNLPAKILMPLIGFPRTTIIGPVWLKLMTSEGANLENHFRKLLELKFDRLLAAHGTLLETGAHEAVERAIDKAFAK
ncbi:MAG: hypothetical protein HQ498_08595 [Pseudohongiella sp.]|nr:hypothetical protein [Pseudohongiella sp.]